MLQVNMFKRNFALIFCFLFLVGISFVSASSFYFGDFLLTQKQDSCFNIPLSCDNCSYMNITVLFPNGTVAVENQEATNLSSKYYYNYTFCETSTLGNYWIILNYDEDGRYIYSDVDFFKITPNGVNLTEGKSFLYIGLLSLLFIMLIISIIGTVRFEHYIGKFTLYWISHILFLILTFSIWQISEGFLIGFIGLSGIFKILFYFSIIAVIPMMILSISWTVYIHAYNEHFQKLIEKGCDTEEAFRITDKKKGWLSGN